MVPNNMTEKLVPGRALDYYIAQRLYAYQIGFPLSESGKFSSTGSQPSSSRIS